MVTTVHLPDASAIAGLIFRPLCGGQDADALYAVRVGCMAHDEIDPLSTLEGLPSRDQILTMLSNAAADSQQDQWIAAQIDECIVGYSRIVSWLEADGTWVYLTLGWVLPERRSQGIGTAMLHWTEDRIKRSTFAIQWKDRGGFQLGYFNSVMTTGDVSATRTIGEANVTRIHRLGLVVLILISWTVCDQVTKNIAKESLASSPPISLLNDSIRIEYTENTGAILGLGANWPSQVRFLFLVVFVSLVLAITLVVAVNTHSFSVIQLVGLSSVAAGGIGNLLDRLLNNGAVIDFMRLGIGPLRTGIFNMADVAIVTGVVTFLLFSTQGKQKAAAN